MRSLTVLLAIVALLVPALCVAQPQTKPNKAELAKLEKLDKAQATAKAAYLKNKKNAKAKQAYIKATMDAADAYLRTPAVSPRQKYPKSLNYYREVRKVDPKNAKANETIKMIEDIYRSLGRPIPPG